MEHEIKLRVKDRETGELVKDLDVYVNEESKDNIHVKTSKEGIATIKTKEMINNGVLDKAGYERTRKFSLGAIKGQTAWYEATIKKGGPKVRSGSAPSNMAEQDK